MTKTLPSLEYILGLDRDQAADLVSQLTRDGELSRLVKDLNEIVLSQGTETHAGEVLRHMGFLV